MNPLAGTIQPLPIVIGAPKPTQPDSVIQNMADAAADHLKDARGKRAGK